jgi:protein O-mannosyl-transferase
MDVTFPEKHCHATSALLCTILFAITVMVFWPACDNNFVNWDDNSYVCNRVEVLNGISYKGLLWAATAEVCGNWHPLTLLSLQLDAQLFGPSPLGFHRTSMLLHGVNAAMAFLAINALTGCLWRSAIVAVLFALHPLRVESVAWVSERKDLVSGFFFFAALVAYARYARSPTFVRYAVVASCLGLGLCAKAMLVTTPCVLLLLDYWPLRRFPTCSHSVWSSSRWIILEKVPLFGLSAIFSLLTIRYQGAAISPSEHAPFGMRITNAITSYCSYLMQTVWPFHLSPFYPLGHCTPFLLASAATILVALTALAICERKRHPYLLVGWLWFLGMLFPVCGMVQVGSQSRADRYTYLPHVGLFVAMVWTVSGTIRPQRIRIAALALVPFLIVFYSILTCQQIAVWRSTETLWQQAFRFYPEDGIVIQHLITCLHQQGKKSEALELTKKVRQATDESNCEKMVMLAMLLAVQGEHESCAETLGQAIRHFPDKAELYSNRGKAHAALGRWQQAVTDYRRAVQLLPRSASFQFYLAHALGKTGAREESRQIFAEALKRSPRWPHNAARDAWRMSTSSDFRERIVFWPICLAEQAIEATGIESPALLDVLAAAYAHSNRFDEAISTARRAIQLAEATQQVGLINDIRERLTLYESHQPYRQKRSTVTPVP